MRKRFEQQYVIGQLQIQDTIINPKRKSALDELCAALKEIYCNEGYNEQVLSILENSLSDVDLKNGRPGMELWVLFVLSQVRMCLNTSYENLHNLANNHHTLRQILGIERESSFGRIEFEYQQIYDNVSKLSDDTLRAINDVIVEFGHCKVFKKKRNSPLALQNR